MHTGVPPAARLRVLADALDEITEPVTLPARDAFIGDSAERKNHLAGLIWGRSAGSGTSACRWLRRGPGIHYRAGCAD